MSETLIRCENVSKKFCRDLKKSLWYGVKDSAADLLAGLKGPSPLASRNSQLATPPLREGEFWANKGISFELKRGECLGLIGRNGAGKTTLLKMLNGLIKPDTGKIQVKGRVGALIALGAGFNPILTGRENIWVNASVLGLKRSEINRHLEEIIDFADIEEFIDSPVCNYSSGMQVRLGFAISTIIEPDVLILDEVLAVGDASFRHKCYHKINKLMKKSAVVLVSHSMDYIAQMATSVGMMEHGKLEIFGESQRGISAYFEKSQSPSTLNYEDDAIREIYPPIIDAQVMLPDLAIAYGGDLEVQIQIKSEVDLDDVIFSFAAVNRNEQTVMCWHSSQRLKKLNIRAGRQTFRFFVKPLLLHAGTYNWNFNMCQRGSIEHLVWFVRAGKFNVSSKNRPVGNIPYLPYAEDIELISFDSLIL